MDRAEAIKAMKSLQDNLGVDRSEENLTTEAATHDKRTETHSCVSKTHGELISRQAAVEEIAKMIKKAQGMGSDFDLAVSYGFMGAKATIEDLPSADTDISEYSDRLWKAAYDRGKAEGSRSTEDMDYCNNCPYISWDNDAVPQLKQTDTLLIADALRYLMQDTNRHLADRTRADALREQMLAYGASMCKPPTERTGWIPCGERLPEEEKEVLVTVHFMGLKQTHPNGWNDHIKPSYYVDIASRIDEEWSSASDEYKIARNRHKTIAWMPLPEPYKGGDTE